MTTCVQNASFNLKYAIQSTRLTRIVWHAEARQKN
jgi:hypothetical protein